MRLALLLVASLFFTLSLAASFDGLINKEVKREVDLTSQLTVQSSVITVQNTGAKEATTYYVAVYDAVAPHVADVTVTDASGAKLAVGASEKSNGYVLYPVSIKLAAGATLTITSRVTFTHRMEAFPKQISQTQPQYVKFSASAFFSSPYATSSQTTTFKTPSSKIEFFTDQPAPAAKKSDGVTYGPYNDVPAFKFSPIELHFENNKPFITVTSYVKELEVSHWGNLAVEEHYSVVHAGAALKGSFSRADYQRAPQTSPAAVKSFIQWLPSAAADVYYRDEIGNISTSHVRLPTSQGVWLELTPRFPLFGGWKTVFYMGYNLPLAAYLASDYSDGSRYQLNATFLTNFEEAVFDDVTVRIILPEGASDISVKAPFAVAELPRETHYTYLDTKGRPVVVLAKKNLVPSAHNQHFQVTYRFSSSSLVREPVLMVVAFFAVCFSFMLFTRIDLRISKPKASSPRVAELVAEVTATVRKDVTEARAKATAALSKFLSSKNAAQRDSDVKSFEQSVTGAAAKLAERAAELEVFSRAYAGKVRELAQLLRTLQKEQRELEALEVAFHVDGNKEGLSQSAYKDKKRAREDAVTAVEDDIARALAFDD